MQNTVGIIASAISDTGGGGGGDLPAPPSGFHYLINADGAYLVNADGDYILANGA
jgi:hypothetical protein